MGSFLQRRDGQRQTHRERLEALINGTLHYVRRSHLYHRLRQLDAPEKAAEEMEKVHDLSSAATRPRLEDIFYLLRLAGRGAEE